MVEIPSHVIQAAEDEFDALVKRFPRDALGGSTWGVPVPDAMEAVLRALREANLIVFTDETADDWGVAFRREAPTPHRTEMTRAEAVAWIADSGFPEDVFVLVRRCRGPWEQVEGETHWAQ